jgi:hypothetical protein
VGFISRPICTVTLTLTLTTGILEAMEDATVHPQCGAQQGWVEEEGVTTKPARANRVNTPATGQYWKGVTTMRQ